MSGTKANVVELVGNLLQSIQLEKQGAAKGQSSHPSNSVDDGTVSAPEGERARENTSDVKKNVGSTTGIAGQEDANSATGTQAADSIGTQKQDSAEVKGNVPTPKTAPEKPGQGGQGDASPNHPTSQTFGEKYSSVTKLANEILAAIAVAGAEKKAEGVAPQTADAAKTFPFVEAKKKKKDEKKEEPKTAEVKTAEAVLEKDAEAGYLAAQALYDVLVKQGNSNKEADQVIATLVKSAGSDAELFVEYMKGYESYVKEAAAQAESKKYEQVRGIVSELRQAKQAGALTKEMLVKAAEDLGAAGEQIPPEELEAMLAADQGGGGAPGGAPPEAAMMGGGAPEGMMGGGAPEGAMGGGAEGGADDATLMAIAKELADAGVTPEELIAAVQGAEGGAPGGAPPEAAMGGGAPEAAPAAVAEETAEEAPAAHEAQESPVAEKKEEAAKTEEKGEEKAGSVQKSAQALAQAILARRNKK